MRDIINFVATKQQLKALDNVANTPEIRLSSGIEDSQSSGRAQSVPQYMIARRPVDGLTQWEGHPSTPPVGPLANETDVVLSHRPIVYPSLEEGQDYSALEVTDFDSVSTPNAQYERQSIIPKPAKNTTPGEKVRTGLLPESPSRPPKEWIPFMLRKVGAFSLAGVLFMLVGLLEYLSQLEQKR